MKEKLTVNFLIRLALSRGRGVLHVP